MISQKWANLGFAVILLTAISYLSWLAWNFETNPFADAFLPVKFFPLLLLGFVAFSVLLYCFEYITKGYSGDDEGGQVFESFGGIIRSLSTIVFTLLAYFIWRMKGFDLPIIGEGLRVPAYAVAGLLLPLATAFAMGARHWSQFAIILILTILVFLAFRFGLNIQFR